MDEQEQVAERSLDDLTKVELEAKIANDRVRIQTLAAKGENMTSAELAEVRKLRAQAPEITGRIDAFKAELEPVVIETPALVAVETPAPVVPAPAPVAEVTDAQIAEVIAEAEKAAVGGDLVAASAGTATFVALSETAPASKEVGFKAAAASGDAGISIGDDLDLGKIGAMLIAEFEARRNTSETQRFVKLASADVLHEDWDLPGLATGNGDILNSKIVGEARRRHRAIMAAKRNAGVKVAAPLGTLAMPVGTPLVFRDLPKTYLTDNGAEIINRIAPVPMAQASGACQVTFQLPHKKSDLAGASVVWTTALQAAIDPDVPSTYKPLVSPPAVGTDTVSVVAFPVGYVAENCYKYQNPEAVADDLHIVASIANDVRVSYALGRFDAKAINLTHNATGGYGALVELRGALRAITAYIHSQGLDHSQTDYCLIVDRGLVDLLAFDEDAAGSYGGNLTRREELLADLGAFGVPVIEVSQTEPTRSSPWATFGGALPAVGAAAAPLPNAPTQFKCRMVDMGAWWAMQPESIAFGAVEDFALMRQNRFALWGETWLGMGRQAVSDDFSISVNLRFDGARSARVAAPTTNSLFV